MAFDTNYGTDPWTNVGSNSRVWYDPILSNVYRQSTIYTDLIQYATQPMLPNNAASMILNQAFDFLPNTDPIPLRHTSLEPVGLDGQQIEINFTRYGFETAYDKYDSPKGGVSLQA